MNIKWYLIGAAAAFLGWKTIVFQKRGNTVESQKKTIVSQRDSIESLSTQTRTLALGGKKLTDENAKLTTQVARLTGEKQAIETAGLRARIELKDSESRSRALVAGMSYLERKRAADALVGGVGVIATTAGDTAINADVANLKYTVTSQQGVIIDLSSENAGLVQTVRNKSDDVAALDKEIERKNKDIAGVRTFVQDRRSEVSKTAIKRLFNGGKIRLLGEVDAEIKKIQY